MTATVASSGSQTATISTEHTLATETTAGTYLLAVDASAMVGGTTPDILELRIYGKARSSDTERLLYSAVFVGVQATPLLLSPPVPSPHHCKVTLKQTQGTGRAFPWATYKL